MNASNNGWAGVKPEERTAFRRSMEKRVMQAFSEAAARDFPSGVIASAEAGETVSNVWNGTPESFVALKKYFGEDRVIPVYIELDDGVRLERALRREKKQETPKYEEMCRRFLTDAEDFSEEKLREAGLGVRFENRQDELESTLQQVREYILSKQGRDDDGI